MNLLNFGVYRTYIQDSNLLFLICSGFFWSIFSIYLVNRILKQDTVSIKLSNIYILMIWIEIALVQIFFYSNPLRLVNITFSLSIAIPISILALVAMNRPATKNHFGEWHE